jgi:hypothetical protein
MKAQFDELRNVSLGHAGEALRKSKLSCHTPFSLERV